MAHTEPPRLNDQTILIVCTGNICRSAYAHYRLLRALAPLGENAPQIMSRGTYANTMLRPPLDLSTIVALDIALDLSVHLPQQLSDRDVQEASIILAASEEHLADVLRRAPAKMKSAFTLAEFAVAAEFAHTAQPTGAGPGISRLETLRHNASAHRSGIRAALLHDVSIEDPYGREASSYESMVATVDRYVDKIAGFLLAADDISTASSSD